MPVGTPFKNRRKPANTGTLTKADLQADSFFKRFSDSRLYDARQGSAAANEDNVRTKMLAVERGQSSHGNIFLELEDKLFSIGHGKALTFRLPRRSVSHHGAWRWRQADLHREGGSPAIPPRIEPGLR